MRRATRTVSTIAIFILSLCMISVAAGNEIYHGTWKSAFDYDGAYYDLELVLEQIDGDSLSGKLRVMEAGYLVDAVGLKTVEISGDSLKIQTGSVEGRGAKFILMKSEDKLSGKMWETQYEKKQGRSWEVLFEKLDD